MVEENKHRRLLVNSKSITHCISKNGYLAHKKYLIYIIDLFHIDYPDFYEEMIVDIKTNVEL